jgi:regulator of sirC expression with transglutaminase-like and TPR domain
MPEPARERLAEIARQAGTELPLAEGALLIAAEEYPSLDAARYLALLDALAQEVRGLVSPGGDPATRIRGLCEGLFKNLGFRGNAEEYDDPRNSFLNDVLDRRRGIPISLAVVTLEVGWRLHLPLYGVGMPGHFLVGCEAPGEPLYVDAFHGTMLTTSGCEHLFRRMMAGGASFREEYLAPTPARYILVRMLRNLKRIYQQREDLGRAAAAIERILLLAPDLAGDVRDLGLIHYRQGMLVEARELLERYLRSAPGDAADRRTTEGYLAQIRGLLGRLN